MGTQSRTAGKCGALGAGYSDVGGGESELGEAEELADLEGVERDGLSCLRHQVVS